MALRRRRDEDDEPYPSKFPRYEIINPLSPKRRQRPAKRVHPDDDEMIFSSVRRIRTPESPLVDLLIDPRYGPIQETLTRCLEIQDIVNTTRTCRRLSSLYQSLIPTHWNLDVRLRRFFKDTCWFRKALARVDGLISGSFAVQFFDRDLWPDAPLELFLGETDPSEMVAFLGEEGYTMSRSFERSTYKGLQAAPEEQVMIFQRCKYHSDGSTTMTEVQLVVLQEPPILYMIKGHYTTACCNFITGTKAYSLYPLHTFIRRQIHLLRDPNETFAEISRIWAEYGWDEDCFLAAYLELETDVSLDRPRQVGDSSTWMITVGIPDEPPDTDILTPDWALECSTFRLTREFYSAGRSVRQLEAQASVFANMLFAYEYVFCDNENDEFTHMVEERLRVLNFHRLLRMTPDKRPADSLIAFPAGPGSTLRVFGGMASDWWPPEGSTSFQNTYPDYDYLMPGFIQEFQEKYALKNLESRNERLGERVKQIRDAENEKERFKLELDKQERLEKRIREARVRVN